MKNMKRSYFALSILILCITGCGAKEKRACKEKHFDVGEKVVFVKTGEIARVVGVEFYILSSTLCTYTGNYKIRLPDGAEITVPEIQIDLLSR